MRGLRDLAHHVFGGHVGLVQDSMRTHLSAPGFYASEPYPKREGGALSKFS
jgi:hypothetical protein